ncbi:hypothetical protein [Candidatus Vondammii sp. HM_W22]|uniref:hypothetical protein n=1 Tax=Candidatus Vondammii sp. HM_W22 TaxID=2687299 RepID=UPI001F1365C8|nr:hypothetical protein [Candidatus Vondammii sp. HM_W22]
MKRPTLLRHAMEMYLEFARERRNLSMHLMGQPSTVQMDGERPHAGARLSKPAAIPM